MSNPEQALTAIAGGVIGFFVGGPAGAFTGFQIGLLAGTALFPTQLPGVTGPRLEDFERLHADPGAPVFVGWGTFVVPGFRLYLGEPIETANTEEVGGKGGPSQEVTTFTYTQTLALGLCEGPIEGVRRIWENGELVYDAREQQEDESTEDYDARLQKSAEYAETFVVYLGTEDQEADPTLELELGEGNVPAFRGLAYMVYPDRQLQGDQANRHPAFKIEIAKPVPLPVLVAVSSNGTQRAARSASGETWTLVDTPMLNNGEQAAWHALAYSRPRRRLVAVGDAAQFDTERMDTMYSDDFGLTWTAVNSGVSNSSNAWRSIIWIDDDGGYYLAGCYSASGAASPALRKSPDGESWTAIDVSALIGNGCVADIAYDPVEKRIACYCDDTVGGGGGCVIYSDDHGATWSRSGASFAGIDGFPFRTGAIGFDTQRKQFLIIGQSNSSFAPPAYSTSGDANTWQAAANTPFQNNGDSQFAVFMPNLGAFVAATRDDNNTTGPPIALFSTNWSTTSTLVAIDNFHWLGAAYDPRRERAMMVGGGGSVGKFAYREAAGAWQIVDMPAQAWTAVQACPL